MQFRKGASLTIIMIVAALNSCSQPLSKQIGLHHHRETPIEYIYSSPEKYENKVLILRGFLEQNSSGIKFLTNDGSIGCESGSSDIEELIILSLDQNEINNIVNKNINPGSFEVIIRGKFLNKFIDGVDFNIKANDEKEYVMNRSVHLGPGPIVDIEIVKIIFHKPVC